MIEGTEPSQLPARVAVIIPARNEADAVGETVAAALAIPVADAVIVVDDGSHDGTAGVAKAAGALVIRHARNLSLIHI